MTNDEIYLVLKNEGIKSAIRGYIANAPGDFWTIFTREGNVFLLDDNFFIKYSLNPIFKSEWGETYLKGWYAKKYPNKMWKKRMKEKVEQ